MYKKVSINPNIKPSEEGNYSIDISPLNNTIALSTNNTCSLYQKNQFIESEEKLQQIPSISFQDTITSSKFTKNGNHLVISDFEYKLSLYSTSMDNQPPELVHQFEPGNCNFLFYIIFLL